MALLGAAQAMGDIVGVFKTNERHMGPDAVAGVTPAARDFYSMLGTGLSESINSVNDLQYNSMDLIQASLLDPDSVNPHDVTIALREATMSLEITKAVVDKAIAAYREIINLR